MRGALCACSASAAASAWPSATMVHTLLLCSGCLCTSMPDIPMPAKFLEYPFDDDKYVHACMPSLLVHLGSLD